MHMTDGAILQQYMDPLLIRNACMKLHVTLTLQRDSVFIVMEIS